MTKYRIRLTSGRVIGPFVKAQLFDLKAKGHIRGNEEAQIFPTGNWGPITSFDFYPELMDENKTVMQTESTDEKTFVIDLTQLRNQKNEKELEQYDHGTIVPVEALTETIRMSSAEQKVQLSQVEPAPAPTPEPEPEEPKEPTRTAVTASQEIRLNPEEGERNEKTQINIVAQAEIQNMRRKQAAAEARAKAEAEEAERLKAEEDARQLALAIQRQEEAEKAKDDSTQMITLDLVKSDLLVDAEVNEAHIEKERKVVQKKKKALEGEDEEEEKPEDDAEALKKKKKKKIIMIVAGALIAYALLFPGDEKPKKPPFQHLAPLIEFPIPFDQAEPKRSQAEFNKGMELFNRGNYASLIQAGVNFKSSYENNLENKDALNFLVRTYAEELKHSKNKQVDAQTLFKLIQGKRPYLVQDPNGVIGLNLFYMTIDKPGAAVDVVQKYLKLNPKNVTQDLFAVHLLSLMKLGKIELSRQFYQALMKAPEKNRYAYEALIQYMLLNQESALALEYADEALKKFPQVLTFYFLKAELLLKEKRYKEMVPLLQVTEEKGLDYNDINRAKFLELTGLLLAAQGNVKQATIFLTKSLQVKDSDELRVKLADLTTGDGTPADTDKLINQSKAVKLLIEARDFYDKRNYELAMSTAARAVDAYPGYIPAELFLSKVQLRLGLAREGLKTIEALVQKYPEDRAINIALVEAYTNTYKFNDARNRMTILASTPLKESWEFASLNARLFLKMGDSLQAMSWLKTSVGNNPLNDADIFSLSEILLKRANFDNARMLLNNAIELDPINPDYRIAYAKLIYETQDDQAAIGYLLSLLDEFGENAKILSEIAIFYYRVGKVKDFQDYKKKIEALPYKDKALYEFMIKAAMMDERYLEVPGLVEQLLAIEPGDLDAMMTAGRVLYEEGKLVEAAKWFKRVQEKLNSYPKVLYYIAKIKFLSKDYDGAMEEIKKDIKDNGENDLSLVFMAEIQAEKGEFIESENLYKRAQKLNPRSYEALVGLADLSTKRNNFDLALDLYKRAMKQKTDEPIIHKKIGDVYRLLGQGTLAIESYKLYLDMEPEAREKANIEAYIQLMQ
ncbi:tetratricopeptide repeat protein [Peredibacter starrii]|uniref:Tetratricopeptide repeat protein n=1 Tax=Peredibacter starrii TaxID=28202 RepID=A0AAX4HR48_9BACT|nr:tetratricopeptide repeat protein [Peredibacter starrii]WPU65424.1 tetratricopeptide repeat protein [Peredibacter starrii]